MCHTHKTTKKQTEEIEIDETSTPQDSEVAGAAETLCRTLLRYKKCIRCGKSVLLLFVFS